MGVIAGAPDSSVAGSPIGAFCGSGAGAEASTTGAWKSTLCCGWVSLASSKLPCRNWFAPGAESSNAPARANLRLQHTQVLLGQDDPRLDVLERRALGSDPQRDEIAAERRSRAA